MIPERRRTRVLWVGLSPESPVEAEFSRRDLQITLCLDVKELTGHFTTSRAIIYSLSATDETSILNILELTAEDAVNHGLRICIVTPSVELSRKAQAKVAARFRQFFKRREVSISFKLVESMGHQVHALAEECARWESGPEANRTLSIEPNQNPETTLLLQRAFKDCARIDVEPLSGGYSGARVLKIHASFAQRKLVNRPLPLYAKIDKIWKIKKELENYQNFVEAAVPFNLRPNPDLGRCVAEGYLLGIIVGNFVEQSEPLWKAARRGHAHEPIYSLFDNAFKSWRLSSVEEHYMSIPKSFERAGLSLDGDAIQANHFLEARRLGAKIAPADLINMFSHLPPKSHRTGVIHGDLHVDNIRARGRDAVLIDFHGVRPQAPLAFDPATLEVSLAFRRYGGFSNGVPQDDDAGWQKTIAELYKPDRFLQPPEPALQQHRREWLWNCIRQIRMIALGNEISPREYQTSVVFALLRRCHFRPDRRYPAFRFAYGYVLAENLLKNLGAVGDNS